jgi:hypothetical protein
LGTVWLEKSRISLTVNNCLSPSQISEAGEAGVTSGTFVFRTLAKWQTSTFYGTLLLGFFITEFATKYTPENDIVYRVFDNWNPCIFFDHYPSTNFTMVGMTLFSFSSAAMTLFMLVHVLLTQPSFFTSMKHITWAGPMILMQMAFTNIFSANAYTDALGGYTNKPDYSGMNATTYAAATAGMTRDEIDGVSPELWFAIMLHTCFFILFIVADIMLVVLTWQHVAVLKAFDSCHQYNPPAYNPPPPWSPVTGAVLVAGHAFLACRAHGRLGSVVNVAELRGVVRFYHVLHWDRVLRHAPHHLHLLP